jgi:two-component system, OmpR family, KDP operon response regulator KdpE
VLRRRGEPAAMALAFGPIEIDLAAHTVRNAGEEVHLTKTEFDLLRTLAVNAGKVLTHRQLLERVWGDYAAGNSQQLRVYINYLRRKLEDDPARPRWIVTEPGVGYRLKSPA